MSVFPAWGQEPEASQRGCLSQGLEEASYLGCAGEVERKGKKERLGWGQGQSEGVTSSLRGDANPKWGKCRVGAGGREAEGRGFVPVSLREFWRLSP